jgi:hypothetical protein
VVACRLGAFEQARFLRSAAHSRLWKFPELRWLDRHHWIPTTVFAAAVLSLGGWPAFLWGYVVSTVLLYHCTFSINSLAHLVWHAAFQHAGRQPQQLVAGAGYVRRRLAQQSPLRDGQLPSGIPMVGTRYHLRVLKVLSLAGMVRDLRPYRVPAHAAQEAA